MDFTKLNKIYIFGAHSRARTLAGYLIKIYPSIKIEAFLTDNTEDNPVEINQVPVVNLLDETVIAGGVLKKNIPVFIGTRGVFHAQISAHLYSLGFTEIYPVTVELDLQLRNDFLKCFFTEIGRTFQKIDNMDCVGERNCSAGEGGISNIANENFRVEIKRNATVYVAKSFFDKALTIPYTLALYEREIQVGASLTKDRLSDDILLDDVGENISHKNKQYCELTAMYWIWKNAKEDIVGLVHYRRHFLLPEDWQLKMEQNEIDVILPVPLYVEPSLEANYRSRHDGSDLDYLFEYVRQQDEAEYQSMKNFFVKGLYSPCNMFIMRKEVLHDLCEWLFPLLDATAEHGGQKEDIYLNRYPGFLSERLLSYFFEKNRDKYRLVYADKNFLA